MTRMHYHKEQLRWNSSAAASQKPSSHASSRSLASSTTSTSSAFSPSWLARCLPHSLSYLSRNGSGENMWSSQLKRYVQGKQQHFSSKFYYIEAVSEMKQTASNRWPHVEASYMYIYVQQSSPKSTRTQLQQRLDSGRQNLWVLDMSSTEVFKASSSGTSPPIRLGNVS